MNTLGTNLPDAEHSRQVFALGQEPNPRKVKRTINTFLLLCTLAQLHEGLENIQACRLAKIVVIQHSYRDLYTVLTASPRTLGELELYFRRSEAVKEKATDAKTEQFPADTLEDLEPFISNERLKFLLTLHSGQDEKDQNVNFTMWRDSKYELLPDIEIESYIELTRAVTSGERPGRRGP